MFCEIINASNTFSAGTSLRTPLEELRCFVIPKFQTLSSTRHSPPHSMTRRQRRLVLGAYTPPPRLTPFENILWVPSLYIKSHRLRCRSIFSDPFYCLLATAPKVTYTYLRPPMCKPVQFISFHKPSSLLSLQGAAKSGPLKFFLFFFLSNRLGF